MKKLFLSLILSLFYLVSCSQTSYLATRSEIYEYNHQSKDWVLYQKNSNVEIILVFEEEYLTIQAQSPSMYKVYPETKKPIESEELRGFRYDAYDFKRSVSCKLDIVKYDEKYFLISIVRGDYNLRFYIERSE